MNERREENETMERDEAIQRQIHAAIDEGLSHVELSPKLRNAIRNAARGEKKMRKKVSAGLVLACTMLVALTAMAVAVTRFGVLAFNPEQAQNEAYARHILTLDETYENEYMTLTVNDAVFDGAHLSVALNVQPKAGCGEGVYVYPRMTATCGGQTQNVEEQSCIGEFFKGFWVPERNQAIAHMNGEYGANYAVLTANDAGELVADPQNHAVTWTLSLDVIRPVYPIQRADSASDAQMTDALLTDDGQPFADAYAEQKILLTDGYDLSPYAFGLPRPEGMTDEAWWRTNLPDRLVASGAFERVDTAEIVFTTQETSVRTLAEPLTFDLVDYVATVKRLSVSFGACDYEIDVTKKDDSGKSAAQEWLDGEPFWQFAVLADGARTNFEWGRSGVYGEPGSDQRKRIQLAGTVLMDAQASQVRIVPCWGTEMENPIGAVYSAQKPVTQEQREMAVTISLP